MPYLPFQEETSREIQLNYALMLSRVSEAMLKSYSEERKEGRERFTTETSKCANITILT